MRPRLGAMIALTVIFALGAPALAQDDWNAPLDGLADAVFAGQKGLGVLVVTPQSDDTTQAVESMVRKLIDDSGLAELVMDDAPLGDISQKSDEEILAAARRYPIDVIVLLRTFPGTDGPSATVWIETVGTAQSNTFRLRRGGDPPWARRPPPNPVASDDPAVVAASNAADFGRQEAAMTRMGALALAETVLLIAAERGRRILSLEMGERSPVVRDPDGDVVPWPQAYTLMERADLADRFRRRRVTRTAAMAGGSVFAAAGLGLLFVGLSNQANCIDGGNCGRPIMIGGGAASLGVGAALIATGLLIRPHPAPFEVIQRLVEDHNAALR